jgi:hypothetical protein
MNTGAYPRKEVSFLRQVIEGKKPCPTLLDLDRLARKKVESPVPMLEEPDQWVESHLLTCESCQDLYEGLEILERAARKALDKVSQAI